MTHGGGSANMEPIVCLHVLVSGMVQGVCYRAFVWEKARELGVTGWVRNLPDGRVEAELQGKRPSVDQIANAMRIGPRAARVTDVEVVAVKGANRYGDFRVR